MEDAFYTLTRDSSFLDNGMHLEAPGSLYIHVVYASRLMPLPKRPYSSALSSPISSRSSLSFSSRLATSSLILSTEADRRSCTSESGNE
jgi:hypothetical protein